MTPAATPAHPALALLALVCVVAMTSACSSVSYYAQAVAGQVEVWRRARPIERVLADDAVPQATRERLARVLALREFAAETLRLDAGGSFLAYADLERPYVVWNVFAAPEFDLTAHQSCFLFVGCLDYRGYFSHAAAERHAAALAARGYDVHVGGVPAYSTLGWFDDPVLNTFLAWPEADLAGLVFHELAHQRLYVSDDTRFNESFATAVAEAGVQRWFAQRPAAGRAAVAALAQQRAVTALVLDLRRDLAALYTEDLDAEHQRRRKQALFETLRARYDALAAGWEDRRYDAWIAAPWNNARVAALVTYNDLVDEFLALLHACDDDFERFYAAAAAAAQAALDDRDAALQRQAHECAAGAAASSPQTREVVRKLSRFGGR